MPSLEEERPDAVIIHVGINNLLHKGKFDEVEKLAEEIIEIGLCCRSYNVNDVFISGIIYSSKADIGMIRRLNEKLNSLCKIYSFIFIDNYNINKMHIWRDGIHLNKSGEIILAKSYIKYLNDFLCRRSCLDPGCEIDKGTYHRLDISSSSSMIDNSTDKDTDFLTILGKLRLKNVNRIIFANININSIRNKFHLLTSDINNKIDILMISETKLDNSFPNGEFIIPGYTEPYRMDRNSHGGGILLYIRSNIPSKEIPNSRLSSPSEGFFVEINLRKKKWLISCSYIPNKSLIQNHLLEISKKLDLCSSRYENFFLFGDFNTEPNELHMEDFCLNYNLSNLIKEPTCFKNPAHPSCIDLILTNFPKSFQNSMAIETGLSDFHKMTITVMKSHYKKLKPNIITYRKVRY